jgi:hypothetical protein
MNKKTESTNARKKESSRPAMEERKKINNSTIAGILTYFQAILNFSGHWENICKLWQHLKLLLQFN